MELKGATEGELGDHVLQRAVGDEDKEHHEQGLLDAADAQGDEDRKRTADKRAEHGDVVGDPADDPDGEGEWNVDDECADADDDAVEDPDERAAPEVAAQKRALSAMIA